MEHLVTGFRILSEIVLILSFIFSVVLAISGKTHYLLVWLFMPLSFFVRVSFYAMAGKNASNLELSRYLIQALKNGNIEAYLVVALTLVPFGLFLIQVKRVKDVLKKGGTHKKYVSI